MSAIDALMQRNAAFAEQRFTPNLPLAASLVAQHGFQLTAATGTGWHVGPGMIVTFVGIGLVALGQFGLWRELGRRKGAASAQ